MMPQITEWIEHAAQIGVPTIQAVSERDCIKTPKYVGDGEASSPPASQLTSLT